MTQVGEGHDAGGEAAPLMTFGVPTVGEILAERYELQEHLNDDSAGRQIWRGIDVVLRRRVAVVLRYPGGGSAAEMLQAAVVASRIVHPNLVGVYDAIDEGERAYVIREWVDGTSLRERVAEGPLDASQAASVAAAVAAALAAMHAAGMAHGNVHPGTVLIGRDGRVVLTDTRTDGQTSQDADLRAAGGVLYFALTGHWPHAEAGTSALPDAVRDPSGSAATPRQIRAGVPSFLDDLATDLLDPRLPVPPADVLAAELGRLAQEGEPPYLEEAGPIRFASEEASVPARPSGRKITFGIVALLAIAALGLFVGIRALLPDSASGNQGGGTNAGPAPGASTPAGAGGTETTAPKALAIGPDQVRVVDPPKGNRTELGDVGKVVDGDPNTAWETDHYNSPEFGRIKPGMGILIDLGQPRHVTSVQVDLSASGATAELRWGKSDPGNTSAGDGEIVKTYQRIGDPYVDYDGTTMAFGAFNPDTTYRYLLFWVTKLPPADGKYQIGVQEIHVEGT